MTDEKPIRPRKVWEGQFNTLLPTRNFDRQLEGRFFRKHFPDDRMALAMQIMERFALIAGEESGEDSAGRQKARRMLPAEIVAFACETSEAAFAEFERRGWMQALPSLDEQEEAARENSDRN